MTCNHTRSEIKPWCTKCDPVHEWIRAHELLIQNSERERIIKLIQTWPWNGLSLEEDRANLVALINGKPMPYKEED